MTETTGLRPRGRWTAPRVGCMQQVINVNLTAAPLAWY